MGDEALEVVARFGAWMFEHPIATGVIFTLALVAAGWGGFWFETRRGNDS